MTAIHNNLLPRAVALLQPYMDQTRRNTFITLAYFSNHRAIYDSVDQTGSAADFTTRCVRILLARGRIGKGHALSLLLDQVRREAAGDDRQREFLDLIEELDRLGPGQYALAQTAQDGGPRHPVREWLAAYPLARRNTRRYLAKLAVQHRDFSFLGRSNPLRLEDIYVGLRVAEHTPPGLVPDGVPAQAQPQAPLAQSGRTLEVPEALGLSRRLLVLGEAGSGKSTLLKYLVLAMARRDPAFGPFARALCPNRLTDLLERLCRALAGTNLVFPNIVLGAIALLAWVVTAFRSDATFLTLAVALFWAAAGFALAIKYKRRWVPVGAALAATVLAYAWLGPYPVGPVTAGLTTLSVAGLLFPYWVRLPLALLAALVRRRTRYPLPILLTLNNLAGDGRPLEGHAAAALAECGLRHGQGLLRRRLEAGGCLLLLDALDEVTDPGAYERVLAQLNRLRHAYGEGNQILVTSRPAGYGYRLEGVPALEVQPFQTPQVAAFVRHWFADIADPGERARRVEGLSTALAHSPRVQALAASPLLLALIALLYEADWGLPERRAEVYDEAVALLTEKWKARKDKANPPRFSGPELRCAMRGLARRAHEAGLRVFNRGQILALLGSALDECRISAAPEDLLDAAMADTGLLRRKSRTTYDFVHLTFQEYLAAEALVHRGEEAALLARAGDPWWREVTRLYAGLAGNAAALLETLLPADPLLAAGCLADARTPGSEAIALAIVARLRHLWTQDPAQRQAAADALAEVEGWGARDLLVGALRDQGQDPALALSALLALAPGAEATLADSVPGGLGPLLRLLHGELPRVEPGLRPRVLTLLEALGYPLCQVPAGEFWMGSDADRSDERPRHRVQLAEYWIDRHPVTNAQFARFAQETGFAGNAWRDAFTPGKEGHPVVNVSWEDATAYAAWCGKRLPTEAEWEKAARGTDARRYPWGDRWDGTKCNVGGRGTTPVGAFLEGLSPCGCQDMAGDVWEWVGDWYHAGYYARSPKKDPLGPETGQDRVMHGGSWFSRRPRARAAYRGHARSHGRGDDVGFRVVCASPIH